MYFARGYRSRNCPCHLCVAQSGLVSGATDGLVDEAGWDSLRHLERLVAAVPHSALMFAALMMGHHLSISDL
jgi:hypothetical protein